MRIRNKLEKDEIMEFRKVESVDGTERAMSLFLSQHGEGWEHKNSIFRTNSNRKLVVELGKLALSTGKGEIKRAADLGGGGRPDNLFFR